MIFTIIRNRNKAREEFEKFILKSVEILAEDEMKMNIHKDKMLCCLLYTSDAADD